MEETSQILALLERMEQANQKQAQYAKWQCVFSAAAAVCCAAVLIVILCLLPQLNNMFQQVDAVLADVQQVSSQLAQADWQGLIADLEQVSQQMAQANLGGLAQDVSSLVQTSQSGVEEALEKINGINWDTLNQAIASLAAVIEPLARFFNRF